MPHYKILVIDYYQKLNAPKSLQGSRQRQLAEVSSILRFETQDQKLHLMLLDFCAEMDQSAHTGNLRCIIVYQRLVHIYFFHIPDHDPRPRHKNDKHQTI